MSALLPIAAAAALAALGIARSGRPAGSRSRLRPVPEGYSTSSWVAVRGTVLEEYLDEVDEDELEESGGQVDEEQRLYHVTTAASRVLEQGLKSRSRLKAQRGPERSYGLGGGLGDEAPDLVSTTIHLSRARTLKHAVQVAIRAAKGQILPADAAIECLKWCDFPSDWRDIREVLGPLDEEEVEELREEEVQCRAQVKYLWSSILMMKGPPPTWTSAWIEQIEKNRAEIEEEWRHRSAGYELIQKIEQQILMASRDLDEIDHDLRTCGQTFGFTEPATFMAKMDPYEVQILALAAKGRAADIVPNECEARFRPESLVVLGVVE